MTVLAAHQPAYLPWLGYFHKIASCDVFVVSDEVQYEDRNFQNRNRVKVNNGFAWLTVPLVGGSPQDRIFEKRIASPPGQNWQRRTWRTLRTHYGPAPHFRRYADDLEGVFSRPWETLVALDMHLLELMLEWLGISRPIVRATSIGASGRKTEGIVDFCRRLGADTYLSGSGGSVGYLDVEHLRQNGIRVVWQRFEHPVYPQRYPNLGFLPNLSALDLILNCGPASRDILLGEETVLRAELARTG